MGATHGAFCRPRCQLRTTAITDQSFTRRGEVLAMKVFLYWVGPEDI
jgi:hypothetical protein